jgi:hypothetical protein
MPDASIVPVPSYRSHKATGQAVVTLNGKDHYLGRYATAESKVENQKITSERLAHGGQLPGVDHYLSVNEIILAFRQMSWLISSSTSVRRSFYFWQPAWIQWCCSVLCAERVSR